MDFNYLKQFHKKAPSKNFKRQKHVDEQYNLHKQSQKFNDFKNNLFNSNAQWVITKNEYPYYFTDKTQHYIVWFKNDINYNLIDTLYRDEEIVYFENKDINKSIKDILHVHVFINKN